MNPDLKLSRIELSRGGPRPRGRALLTAALLGAAALAAPALAPRAGAAAPPVPASCALFVQRYFGSAATAGHRAPFTLATEASGRRVTYAEGPSDGPSSKLHLTLSKHQSLIGPHQTLSGTGSRFFSDRRTASGPGGQPGPGGDLGLQAGGFPFDPTRTETLGVKLTHTQFSGQAPALAVALTPPGGGTQEYTPQGYAGIDVLYATRPTGGAAPQLGGEVVVISVGALALPPPDPK
jgi:hypothetical protein